jgi:hypothetical protein
VSAARVLHLAAASGMPLRNEKRYISRRIEEAEEQADDTGELAFYRKYTEQFLRRYMWTSMQMGRSPSVLGNLVFRGKASHTGLRNFEDAIIFVHDVESCLKKLDREGRELIARIALQEYTQGEVAVMLGTSVRTIMRRYAETLDRLTQILLEVKLLKIPRY